MSEWLSIFNVMPLPPARYHQANMTITVDTHSVGLECICTYSFTPILLYS